MEYDYWCDFWPSNKRNILGSVKSLRLLLQYSLKFAHLGMFTCAGPAQQ